MALNEEGRRFSKLRTLGPGFEDLKRQLTQIIQRDDSFDY
jgi:hypothetical protein